MFAKRFTQAQILCGLRIFWREETGGNDSFDAGTRIDHHLESEGISEEIDITEILHDIEQFFRFSCRLEEWQSYVGWDTKDQEEWERKYAPQFTFGRLADFIRERVEAISLEPLTLLGKPCLTAGIFRGLERLAEQINPKTPRFAPTHRSASVCAGLAFTNSGTAYGGLSRSRYRPHRGSPSACAASCTHWPSSSVLDY